MKYISAVFIFFIWCIVTIILVISLFGLVVVIDNKWVSIPETILNVFNDENNIKKPDKSSI